MEENNQLGTVTGTPETPVTPEMDNGVNTSPEGGDEPPKQDGGIDPPTERGNENIKQGFENNKESIDRTRSVIAFRFIIGFFGVVFLVFVTGWSKIFEESTFKDMLLTIVGTLSSSLGFIIGYYFKSSEDKRR